MHSTCVLYTPDLLWLAARLIARQWIVEGGGGSNTGLMDELFIVCVASFEQMCLRNIAVSQGDLTYLEPIFILYYDRRKTKYKSRRAGSCEKVLSNLYDPRNGRLSVLDRFNISATGIRGRFRIATPRVRGCFAIAQYVLAHFLVFGQSIRLKAPGLLDEDFRSHHGVSTEGIAISFVVPRHGWWQLGPGISKRTRSPTVELSAFQLKEEFANIQCSLGCVQR